MSEEQQTLAVRCSPQKADTFEDDTIIRLVAKMDGAPTDAPYIAFTAFDSTPLHLSFEDDSRSELVTGRWYELMLSRTPDTPSQHYSCVMQYACPGQDLDKFLSTKYAALVNLIQEDPAFFSQHGPLYK